MAVAGPITLASFTTENGISKPVEPLRRASLVALANKEFPADKTLLDRLGVGIAVGVPVGRKFKPGGNNDLIDPLANWPKLLHKSPGPASDP